MREPVVKIIPLTEKPWYALIEDGGRSKKIKYIRYNNTNGREVIKLPENALGRKEIYRDIVDKQIEDYGYYLLKRVKRGTISEEKLNARLERNRQRVEDARRKLEELMKADGLRQD